MSVSGAVHEDGWAIFALPPGRRDLGSCELWERSLTRSKLRRQREAARRANVPTARKVGFALAATAILTPSVQTATAQQTIATSAVETGMLKKGSKGPAVVAVQQALGIPADGIFGRQTKRAVKSFQATMGSRSMGSSGRSPGRRCRAAARAPDRQRARSRAGPSRSRCSRSWASRRTGSTGRSRAPR